MLELFVTDSVDTVITEKRNRTTLGKSIH